MSTVVSKTTDLLEKLGIKWKVDGKLLTPSQQDVQQVLDNAKRALYSQPIESQLMIGQMIVKKYAKDKYDVYLRIGEL